MQFPASSSLGFGQGSCSVAQAGMPGVISVHRQAVILAHCQPHL
ncbi:hypothetical protein AAY473_021901 [Plecturocebus cupreus]